MSRTFKAIMEQIEAEEVAVLDQDDQMVVDQEEAAEQEFIEEIIEQSDEQEQETAEVVEEVEKAGDTAEAIQDTIEVTEETMETEGDVPPQLSEVVETAMEAYWSSVGYKPKRVRPNMESFTSKEERLQSMRITLEDAKNTIKQIWIAAKHALVMMFKRFWNWLKDVGSVILSKLGLAKLDEIVKEAKSKKDSDFASGDIQVPVTALLSPVAKNFNDPKNYLKEITRFADTTVEELAKGWGRFATENLETSFFLDQPLYENKKLVEELAKVFENAYKGSLDKEQAMEIATTILGGKTEDSIVGPEDVLKMAGVIGDTDIVADDQMKTTAPALKKSEAVELLTLASNYVSRTETRHKRLKPMIKSCEDVTTKLFDLKADNIEKSDMSERSKSANLRYSHQVRSASMRFLRHLFMATAVTMKTAPLVKRGAVSYYRASLVASKSTQS